MAIRRNQVDEAKLNPDAVLPFELRLKDFAMAMQDVYDFFHDVNVGLVERGLERLVDMLLPAIIRKIREGSSEQERQRSTGKE